MNAPRTFSEEIFGYVHQHFLELHFQILDRVHGVELLLVVRPSAGFEQVTVESGLLRRILQSPVPQSGNKKEWIRFWF